jgi:hypothetical protein
MAHRDIEFIKQMWKYNGANIAIREGDLEGCISLLEGLINYADKNSAGPAAYAFLYCLIADLYSDSGEKLEALKWRNKLMHILEEHPEIENVDLRDCR